MKKILTVVLVLVLALSLVACGSNNTVSDGSAGTEVAETGGSDYETVAVGNKISTDFVELTITESGIVNSLKTSITNGNITYTFGPNDSAETEYAFIKGKIMNKATEAINKEMVAIAKVGEYTLKEDGLDIYKSDGDTVWELAPLVEYNFMMYVEIPNALVNGMESCDFNFGFNENMQSSFSDFEEFGYKYSLKIIPETEAPATETVE